MHRPKKFFSPRQLREPASRNVLVFFSQRSWSGEICGSKSCAVREKGVIHKRGNSSSCAPAARAALCPPAAAGKTPMHRGACTFRKELPIKGKTAALLPPFIIKISLQDQCGCNRIYVFTVLLLLFAAAVQNVVCSNRGAPLVPQHDRQTGLRVERIR